MSTEKTTNSNGETRKTQRASRSRKPNSAGSPPTVTTKVVTPTEAEPVTEVTLSVPDNAQGETGVTLDAPVLEQSSTQSRGADAPTDSAADNNVDNHEGEIMASGNEEPTTALAPAKEGQLVAQSSGGRLVPKVASTITIAGGQRPIMESTLQVKEMFGNRPIFASDLQIYETVNDCGLRPILVSPFQIVGSLDAAGHRPIGANDFEMVGTINVSGIRPIGVSTLHVTEMLTEKRPIASNDIDDAPALMGYID